MSLTRKLHVEGLEARRLLTTLFHSASGVLTVSGTSQAEDLVFSADAGYIKIEDGTTLLASSTSMNKIPFTAISKLRVFTYDGDDSVDMSAVYFSDFPASMGIYILTGNGSDTVTGSTGTDPKGIEVALGNHEDTCLGRDAADLFFGGAGRDTIKGAGGSVAGRVC